MCIYTYEKCHEQKRNFIRVYCKRKNRRNSNRKYFLVLCPTFLRETVYSTLLKTGGFRCCKYRRCCKYSHFFRCDSTQAMLEGVDNSFWKSKPTTAQWFVFFDMRLKSHRDKSVKNSRFSNTSQFHQFTCKCCSNLKTFIFLFGMRAITLYGSFHYVWRWCHVTVGITLRPPRLGPYVFFKNLSCQVTHP